MEAVAAGALFFRRRRPTINPSRRCDGGAIPRAQTGGLLVGRSTVDAPDLLTIFPCRVPEWLNIGAEDKSISVVAARKQLQRQQHESPAESHKQHALHSYGKKSARSLRGTSSSTHE